MHRQHQSAPLSPKSGAASLAQTNQYCLPPSPRDIIGHQLNLPPSIPVSLDGEEGAFAYTQHLLQSNTDIKPECYQAPPNRTIHRRMSGDSDVLGGMFHSTVASSPEPQRVGSTVRLTSAVGKRIADKQSYKGALPAVPYQYESNDDVDTGDYVSSSLLSSWRSSSSDRTAMRDVKQQQQRSSSADSVKRMVKRFFSRKSSVKVPTLKTATHTDQNPFDKFEGVGACAGLKVDPAEDMPWDLPPNYVDMIFSKDPITNESQSDVVEDASECRGFHKV